jgi:processive 1,2-diacylglycerol beta-glucosyltransferase
MQRGMTLDPMLAEGFRMLAERDLSGGTDAGGIDSAFDRILFRLLRWSFPGHRQTQGRVAIAVRRSVIGLGQWRMAVRLRDIVDGFEPDCIIVTQPLPAALLSLIGKRKPIGVPVVGVLVNWGAIEFYAQAAIDFYCVPHESIPLLELLEPFVVTGMPLRKGFRNPPRREEARRRLRLDPERPAVLVQGGGLGLHVVRLARALLSLANVQILVQAGNNEVALQVYISAADVVVGKPGGMTVGECLACGRPLIVIDSLRGQETLNLEFIEQMGVGWEVAEQDLVPTVTALLDDRERLRQVQQRAWDIGERRGAERVAELVGSCTVEKIHA